MAHEWTVERHMAGVNEQIRELYEVSDPRIVSDTPYTARLFVHHFRISGHDQLDDEFAGWLAEAYAVGEGAHLRR